MQLPRAHGSTHLFADGSRRDELVRSLERSDEKLSAHGVGRDPDLRRLAREQPSPALSPGPTPSL